MKRLSTILMMCAFCFMAVAIQAQTVVEIPPTVDFENPTDILPYIMGDTAADGTRNDVNTIYKLENGGFYITSGRLDNKPEWPLHIEATDLSATDNKPVLTVIPNASGTYPEIGRPEGDVTFKNLWIVAGEKGPGENPEWGQLRLFGENSTVIVEDCLFEKDRGGFLQFRANGCKVYVSNSTFRNAGNRRMIEGNGRGIDARNFSLDTLVVKNCIFYNIHDRIFRSMGATTEHNYLEWDHNTVFNHFGRHGCFQFGRAIEVVVTNNLLINPLMTGTTPVLCNEQTQVDNDAHKVFTIDTLYTNTSFTFSNNNIFWTQDVLDFWAGNDTIANSIDVYSEQIAELIGDEAAQAATYFSEVLELNSVPMSIYPLLVDTYTDPASTEMFDIIVEDISRAGTDFDYGNLFDFATFDAAFDPGMYPLSRTGATDGTSVGAIDVSGPGVGIEAQEQDNINLKVYPNPSLGYLHLAYNLERSGNVKISVSDISGREQMILLDEFRPQGANSVSVDLKSELSAGLYLINVQTETGNSIRKVILK